MPIWPDAPLLALATGFGAGYSRIAPGTVGSLWGLPLVWVLQQTCPNKVVYGLVTLVLVLIGVPICARACEHFGRHDPGSVVYDEIIAVALTFMFTDLTVVTGTIGFLLFRLFDIWKPWPIRAFERLPHGWGIMTDDLLAGIYAAIGLWISALLMA
ncbi:phosphatidylglycerophosphatase A family protein [Maioricimonas rarisocia]|nr:phosphatidylglycerophosphatase A [Maioricimonas rarisocia]